MKINSSDLSRHYSKLLVKTVRDSNDIANGLEKLRNLRHCSRNSFSNKIKHKLQSFSQTQNKSNNLANETNSSFLGCAE